MTTTSNAAKYVFFYLLSLVALVFASLATGMIIFQIINKLISDVPGFYQGSFSDSQLKYGISQLLISAPILFFTMRQIHRYLFSGELENDSPVRKWLTYLMLFVSSLVLIGWLIATLNSFMHGELTAKFALKALTAIGISAAVFSYFLYDLKRAETKGRRDGVVRAYFYGALALVAASLAGALFVVESPAETRNRKLDDLTVSSFSQIDSAVNSYYLDRQAMPASLDELREEFSYLRAEDLKDQETGESYEYKVSGEKSYELCATFRTDNTGPSQPDLYVDDRWRHGAGRQCLKQTVHNPALSDKLFPEVPR